MRRLGPALALSLVLAGASAAGAARGDDAGADARALSRPQNVVGLGGYELAQVSWDWAANDDTTYRVFRASSATGPWKLVASQPEATYVLRGLPNGRTVWFSVAAVLDGQQSPRTAAVAVTPSPTYALGPAVDVVGYAGVGVPSPAYAAFAVSATGKRVVYASDHLGWHDIETGKTKNPKLHSTNDLATDASGRFVVINQYYQGAGVTNPRWRTAIVDMSSPKQVTELDATSPSPVDISADAGLVAYVSTSGDDTSDARLLDRTTGQTRSFSDLPDVEPPAAGVTPTTSYVALSADGSTAALATNATIDGEPCYAATCAAVWDLATGDVRTVPSAGDPEEVALSEDGSVLAAGADDLRVVRLGPVATADQLVWQSDPLHADTGGAPGTYGDVAITPVGDAVAYYSTRQAARSTGGTSLVGTLHVHDLVSGETRTLDVPVATGLPAYSFQWRQNAAGASFAEDGRYLLSIQATRPGATEGDWSRRADLVRWDWAATAPDAD